ncbi:carbonic anhydrase [Chitinophaga agrisoli]|uniref:Carbonic anhydrase n=1 Tax=Chitinophaga agrisoli TaxID=2607653 RepID=A0A5B2VUD7_9BACT|nr:carbonic anhydrase family protein [Chitinophaga agrisoli]KAA2242665.1 carbonic anhydrase [Chitinophaga agrisoli]
MRDHFPKLLCILLLVAAVACNTATNKQSATKTDTLHTAGDTTIDLDDVLENQVLTWEQQQALTPEQVIDLLKEGNEDFVNDRLTVRNYTKRVRQAANGQYPKAVILSCLDSRVPVEDVFHRGIGDIFVGRVAGNIVNEDMLGSMEFGCKASGAKLILVLGHEHCGAIKSAIDEVKLGNITALLEKIRPAVKTVQFDGERSTKNKDFVHAVCEQNVKLTIDKIRKNSPILADMEKNKEIMIVGAMYDMSSGMVTFLK